MINILIFALSPLFLRLRLVAVGLLALIVAAGCSSGPLGAVSGVFGGGGDDDDEDEEVSEEAAKDENRLSILAFEETLQADPRYAGLTVDVPPSYKNLSWPQPGGEADHTLHHLSGEVAFKKIWRTSIGQASARRARLTAPPVVADGRVYVTDAEATVTAYAADSGDDLWETKLAPKIKRKFRIRNLFGGAKKSQIGFGGGVAYDESRVFVTSGFGFIAGLDAETGEEQWRYEASAPLRTPPTAHRGSVFFVTITNELIALDQATGERQWGFQSFEENARILSSASPAAAGDLVVAPFSSGEVVAFLADSGRAVWNDTLSRSANLTALATLNDIAGSPVIDRGLVYVVSHAGRLTAIDIRSGGRVWESPIAGLQMPWVAGDYLFIVSVEGELVCLSREEGAIIWISQLQRYRNEKKKKGRISWAGPVLVGGHLILVSTEGEVVKVNAQDGIIADRKKVSSGSIVSPIIADETVFVLTEDGQLFAMK
ncbi:MAG: PQQ-binding-like beta-propeller repeat protein [Pseudomonadota bacterium]